MLMKHGAVGGGGTAAAQSTRCCSPACAVLPSTRQSPPADPMKATAATISPRPPPQDVSTAPDNTAPAETPQKLFASMA
jgi:hypothetical protein